MAVKIPQAFERCPPCLSGAVNGPGVVNANIFKLFYVSYGPAFWFWIVSLSYVCVNLTPKGGREYTCKNAYLASEKWHKVSSICEFQIVTTKKTQFFPYAQCLSREHPNSIWPTPMING